MNPVFVDASGLIALGSKRDKFHKQAEQWRIKLIQSRRPLFTTNAVLFEITSYFSQSHLKPFALQLLDNINGSKLWFVITVDEILMRRGIELFKSRQDKDWSLVDCIGILIAEDFGITEIFTNDHHFEQAGFTNLLK